MLTVPFNKLVKCQYHMKLKFHALINELTKDLEHSPWEPISSQLHKKFTGCCGTWSFIHMLTIAHILSLFYCDGNLLHRICAFIFFFALINIYNIWLPPLLRQFFVIPFAIDKVMDFTRYCWNSCNISVRIWTVTHDLCLLKFWILISKSISVSVCQLYVLQSA